MNLPTIPETADAILERLVALHPKSIDLSLDRMWQVLAALDHPERRLPPVIHIAGTNGKGSTSATLKAVLEAAGKSVHVYTSPHLVRFNERVRLGAKGGGRFVSDVALAEALLKAEDLNGGSPITIFEITTAAAFDLFAAHPADYLLLEVGLGGRLDATNVVDRPLATLITPIAFDHEAYLGSDIRDIAREKAGILKKGVPAIVAPQADAVTEVIEARADEIGAPLVLGGRDWMAHEEHGRLVYQDEGGLLDLPAPRLIGDHQFVNTGLALATLRALDRMPPTAEVEAGLAKVDWPARMQRLSFGNLVEEAPEDAELWVDGGHNPAAGQAVATVMADLQDRAPRPLVLIAGMLSTKDPVGFFSHFAGLARDVLTVPIAEVEAAVDPGELADAARDVGLPARPFGSIGAALRHLAAEPFDAPPRILICGSLYLAGEALDLNGTPPE
ncbi:bifunctional folylpolyglutamate synthase/dihydrofolate synthase [Rhodobium orientis]|uniref:tetrahydrofolate synthase n=1 Tax=Rhodobium orientis TaxID=34017 RepID=A0A327JPB2_9HYPH|nr:folylpolyglutamate synthase/dihydrofolate synthase family protein [Rhodobium orientis]MBK5950240.1 bifunctional folylpolyglutamate synthase/dihydrofolate synthase [Rhodobium orientis]RAI27194.1 bifunctional folylpolyglutamate synthase/dihydrofolate synthase [Rhodobium orientis]